MTQLEKWTTPFSLAAILTLAPAFAQTSRQPLARVGTQEIYDEDLLPSIAGQLWQLKNQEYDLKSKALRNVINQKLLEAAAKSKNLSPEAFLEETVDRAVPPPSASETEAYYLAQKDRFNRPLSEVKPQVEQALLQAKRQQARQDYVDAMRDKAAVSILLMRPKVEVAADPSRLRGNPEAPVTIVEFSDFQCPYCQATQSTVKAILDKYKGKVRLGYRDFPLRQIHGQAQQAAEASRCAGDQGKFWEYHDLLYANQSKLDQGGLTEQARTAGLDVPGFSACLASGRFKAPVDGDLQAGMIAGVSGTPAFFINGVLLSGNQPISEFEKAIDAAIAAPAARKTAP
ncbi:MAG TPA: thioredoxin domain-containing protein [Bryobacteraceae bacterium]|nr:thioredoxin domain-containing protein [Bryobacteraceae bacterium]